MFELADQNLMHARPLLLTRTMTKIRCVSYTDAFSADGCSLTDLQLGVLNGVVGCNSSVFGSSQPGDLVIMAASSAKKQYFALGTLGERLPKCSVWKDAGGHIWAHNFTYVPLAPGIHERTDEVNASVAALCTKHGVDPRYFFHPRFCGERYAPVLQDLVRKITNTTE